MFLSFGKQNNLLKGVQEVFQSEQLQWALLKPPGAKSQCEKMYYVFTYHMLDFSNYGLVRLVCTMYRRIYYLSFPHYHKLKFKNRTQINMLKILECWV